MKLAMRDGSGLEEPVFGDEENRRLEFSLKRALVIHRPAERTTNPTALAERMTAPSNRQKQRYVQVHLWAANYQYMRDRSSGRISCVGENVLGVLNAAGGRIPPL